MPVRQLYVDLVRLGYAEDAVRGVIGLFQHSSYTDSFEFAPTYRQEVKFSCDASVYSFPVMASDTDKLYEIVLYSNLGELCRLFFSMPDNDAYLHQLETYTTPNKGGILIRKRFTDLDDTPNQHQDGSYLVSRNGRLVFTPQIDADDINLAGSLLENTLNQKADENSVAQRFNTQNQVIDGMQDILATKASSIAVSSLQQQVDQKVTKDYVDLKYPTVNEMIRDINAEFDNRDVLIQQTIQNTLASSYIRNVFDTEVKLKAFIPNQVDYYAKALDTGKIWCYGKLNPTDTSNAWHDKGLSELDQAKNYIDVYAASIDALKIHTGKAYPLKAVLRNNILSPANTYFNNCILKIRIINAVPDKYYRLAYFKNGNTTIVGALDGWVIEEFDKLNFETSNNTPYRVIDYTHPAPEIKRDGTIQTVKVQSNTRLEFQAYITLDTSKLPAVGTPVTALNGGINAWSWIIDPSCYEYEITPIQSGLTINQGKIFPCRLMKRNNIESSANSFLRDAILAVKVAGARQGYYYGIRYFKNGTNLLPGPVDGWIIEEQAIADYGTSEAAAQVIALNNNSVPNIDRTKGIQTIILESPTVKNLKFHLTIDPSKFPPYGEFIRMNYSSNEGYSLIIDPSCYEYPVLLPENALTINQGKEYPNRKIARDNETSGANTFLLDSILDIKVLNARGGYYYGIRYFKNGTNLLPGPVDGWIIEEQAIADYATTETATRIIAYTDACPDIPRGGIQTVRLVSPRSSVEFIITLDTDKLPPYESYVSMLNKGSAGRSWIIDPSCYEYQQSIPLVEPSNSALTYTCTAAGQLHLVWQSGAYLYRLRFGPNGYNNLPNIIRIDRAPFGDRNTAQWINVNSASTDWLPPLVVEAINNGDGKGQIYTGGNHGADGSAGGGNTARNIHYQILADGQPMKMGEAFSGNAEKVSVQIVNELMAFNTTGTVDTKNFPSRYVLSQSFAVDIYPGSMEVSTEVKAYEQISVRTDNGPQTVSVGYQETMLYLDGQFATRVPFDNSTNSGIKTQYPKVWALVLQHSINGQFVAWMDREYEAGDGRYVSGNAPYIRGGFTTNTKFYHAAVAGGIRAELQVGEKYKWRGGYAWQAPNLQGVFDSTIVFHKNGKMTTALVKTASDYAVL